MSSTKLDSVSFAIFSITCDTSYFSTYINLLTKMCCPNNNQLVPIKQSPCLKDKHLFPKKLPTEKKVKMHLLQCMCLCKFDKVEGQNTCDQLTGDRRFKHARIRILCLKPLNQHIHTKKRSDCYVPVWPGL